MTGFWAWFHDGWEIVGALASAVAVIVAVWLASHERADRKVAERDRDAAREAQWRAEQAAAQREREAQARQVAVWEADDDGRRVLHIGNYSNAPILRAMLARRLQSTSWKDGAPPVESDSLRLVPRVSFDVVFPGALESVEVPRTLDDGSEFPTAPRCSSSTTSLAPRGSATRAVYSSRSFRPQTNKPAGAVRLCEGT